MSNATERRQEAARFPSDPPWLQRVSANQLRHVAYPRCAETCALVVKLAPGECPDTCRWKFDDHGVPIPEPAGRLRRWSARIVDGLIIGLVLIPAAIALRIYQPDLVADTMVTTAVLVAAYYVVYGILNGWMLGRHGQTIGKWALGIRIMRTDHRPVSFARLFLLRELAPGLSQALPWIGGLIPLVDAVFILGSERQCLHDMMADTKVVRIASRRLQSLRPPPLPAAPAVPRT